MWWPLGPGSLYSSPPQLRYELHSTDPGRLRATEPDVSLIDEERHQGDINEVTPAKLPEEVPLQWQEREKRSHCLTSASSQEV